MVKNGKNKPKFQVEKVLRWEKIRDLLAKITCAYR